MTRAKLGIGMLALGLSALCPLAAAAAPAQDPPLKVRPRIVGGVLASAAYAPWQVSLFWNAKDNVGSHFCSGAFIAPDWVLTAAHCVAERARKLNFKIYAQSHDLRAGGAVFAWDRVYVHKRWDAASDEGIKDNDIALIHVGPSERAGIGPALAAAVLVAPQDAGNVASPARVVVSGWGQTETGAGVMELRRVDLPIVANSDCAALYPGLITANMFCAGGVSRQDACKGDSGGPVVLADSTPPQMVVGVVSAGPVDCGTAGQFGVYTRLSQYAGWIANIRAGYPQDVALSDALAFKPPGN